MAAVQHTPCQRSCAALRNQDQHEMPQSRLYGSKDCAQRVRAAAVEEPLQSDRWRVKSAEPGPPAVVAVAAAAAAAAAAGSSPTIPRRTSPCRPTLLGIPPASGPMAKLLAPNCGVCWACCCRLPQMRPCDTVRSCTGPTLQEATAAAYACAHLQCACCCCCWLQTSCL
jgi:hypothetical protein